MDRTAWTKAAASSLVAIALMGGCSGAGSPGHPSLTAAPAPNEARAVEQALAARDFGHALTRAEALVAASPRDGAARALLGRAYLANGRYASAETAFADALTLARADPRTIISLALVKAGLGKADEARAILADHIGEVPASDYGLAMALAGDPQEGVRALLEAVAMPDATVKTRQNLAYALALSGQWGQARLVAGRDLSAGQLQARLAAWAQTAQPGGEVQRVAAIIGVGPRGDDSGLPARLALDAAPASPTATALADAAGEPAAPAPEAVPAANVPSFAPPAPAATPARRAAAIEPGPAPRPVARPAVQFRPVTGAAASNWIVQLGAFDSAPVAQVKWTAMRRAAPQLAAFAPLHSQATLGGRSFHRVSVSGFASRAVAISLCQAIRARGIRCFVRQSDAPLVQTRIATARPQPARAVSATPVRAAAAAAPARPRPVQVASR
jgi:Flp pilus assembly protein TadD